MQSNQFLADALLWLYAIIPALLVAIKLAHPQLRWRTLWLVTPVASWLLTLTVLHFSARDYGSGAFLLIVTGWAGMLPALASFAFLHRLFARWAKTRFARIAVIALTILIIAIPITACSRWIPETEAKQTAALRLHTVQHDNFHFVRADRTWSGWTVRVAFPDGHDDYPIYLSRSGYYFGRGG